MSWDLAMRSLLDIKAAHVEGMAKLRPCQCCCIGCFAEALATRVAVVDEEIRE